MTLRRWRIWSVIGNTTMLGGMIFAAELFRAGSSAWMISAAVAVAGLMISCVAALSRYRAEQREAADGPVPPPNPNRWRVTEIGRDED